MTFSGLEPPSYRRAWQMGVLGNLSFKPPQPHPLTLLLKEPEERREVAAQEHHHDCSHHWGRPLR